MILVLYTTHLGANLEDDAVIRPIDLDDDAFLLSITLPSLQHALQEDACPCHLPERKTRRPRIGAAVRISNPTPPSAYAPMCVPLSMDFLTYTFPKSLTLSIIFVE